MTTIIALKIVAILVIFYASFNIGYIVGTRKGGGFQQGYKIGARDQYKLIMKALGVPDGAKITAVSYSTQEQTGRPRL